MFEDLLLPVDWTKVPDNLVFPEVIKKHVVAIDNVVTTCFIFIHKPD
jgi:hypothetical protein